ncbi:hypothetical protein AB3S75_035605 [Citrus x aurantiifolia]
MAFVSQKLIRRCRHFGHRRRHPTAVAITLEPPMMIPTRIDWHDTLKFHVFKADLLGFHKHDVKVEIEDRRVLCISEEKKIEKEEKTNEGHCLEVAVGKFSRHFQLLENAMVDRITTHIANSTLTVTIPKKDIKKHHGHSRSIKIIGI